MSAAPGEAAAPAPAAQPVRAAPRFVPWLCLGLLTLPFHPLWVDFEQVRRGLMLLLTGAVLLAWPRLPHVRGERFGNVFLLVMTACALLQVVLGAVTDGEQTRSSFQPWLAAYRLAHWLALLTLVRVGAACRLADSALPIGVTLGVTSLFGLLQGLGVAAIGTYGMSQEPVSTLGNLNVASEWTAVAAAAAAVLLPAVTTTWRRFVLPAALVLAAAYLVVNHSRSGLIALPIGLSLLAILRRKQRGYLPLLYALGGALLGLLLNALAPPPAPLDLKAERAAQQRSTTTLEVRFEIARGAGQLLAESPVFGHGPGQFQVQYPRHRSQRELEASSYGREFASEVRTAHDDWIELMVDGGLPALVLFACMLFALQRGMRDKARLVPLFVLLLLMLVRAPLFNAPAAAAAFWLVGTPMPDAPPRGRRRHLWLPLAAGAALLFLGALPVTGNQAFAPYLAAQRDGEQPPVDAATSAGWWMPYEPRWREVEAREFLLRGELQHAEDLAREACALRPFAPQYRVLLGEVLARRQDWGQAFQQAKMGLAIDPQNPELHVLQSVAFAELGDVDRAIEAVAITPHPVLRARLERHFADLALRAEQRGEPQQARRYLIEFAFVGFLDRLGLDGAAAREERDEMLDMLTEQTRRAERAHADLRARVCQALMALQLDKPALAAEFAKVASQGQARLLAWQRALLGDRLDALRTLPEWRPLLGDE